MFSLVCQLFWGGQQTSDISYYCKVGSVAVRSNWKYLGWLISVQIYKHILISLPQVLCMTHKKVVLIIKRKCYYKEGCEELKEKEKIEIGRHQNMMTLVYEWVDPSLKGA